VKKSVHVYLADLAGVPCPLKITLQCSPDKKAWEPLLGRVFVKVLALRFKLVFMTRISLFFYPSFPCTGVHFIPSTLHNPKPWNRNRKIILHISKALSTRSELRNLTATRRNLLAATSCCGRHSCASTGEFTRIGKNTVHGCMSCSNESLLAPWQSYENCWRTAYNDTLAGKPLTSSFQMDWRDAQWSGEWPRLWPGMPILYSRVQALRWPSLCPGKEDVLLKMRKTKLWNWNDV